MAAAAARGAESMKKRISKYKQAIAIGKRLNMATTDKEALFEELEAKLIIWCPHKKTWAEF